VCRTRAQVDLNACTCPIISPYPPNIIKINHLPSFRLHDHAHTVASILNVAKPPLPTISEPPMKHPPAPIQNTPEITRPRRALRGSTAPPYTAIPPTKMTSKFSQRTRHTRNPWQGPWSRLVDTDRQFKFGPSKYRSFRRNARNAAPDNAHASGYFAMPCAEEREMISRVITGAQTGTEIRIVKYV
jgi:hypothetical protein